MHVGYAPIFQNPGKRLTDREVYRHELKMADLAEPLGFDSIWEPEHHFTDYEMTPDVVQFLTYMAGRTRAVKLGSMVVVLPWHDPVRVAEQVVLLDHLSDGRAIFGMGRGLGAVEFDGFRVPMTESRQIFKENAEAIVNALQNGYIEYDGQFLKQPRRDIRPAPFKSFENRLFGAGLSPESGPLMARLGVAMMIVPLKAWEDVRIGVQEYEKAWELQRPATTPPAPTIVYFVFVDKNRARARELATKYIGNNFRSVLTHYDMAGDRLKGTKGYEFYSKLVQGGEDEEAAAVQRYVDLMPYGTPDEVIDKINSVHSLTKNSACIVHTSFGGMEYDEAERNMRLFASEVLPAVKAIKTRPFGPDIAVETDVLTRQVA
jgi:alkanesulfonate monooxygenase SsuD/methylene tetrahydromethanopterin reductase-like flavin-dependent oxidoreductase (luciferase family)